MFFCGFAGVLSPHKNWDRKSQNFKSQKKFCSYNANPQNTSHFCVALVAVNVSCTEINFYYTIPCKIYDKNGRRKLLKVFKEKLRMIGYLHFLL
jgi:hypothetical protein